MRTLKSLTEPNSDIWFFCRTEELQISFLNQAENEGFRTLNGQNPTDLFHQQLYGTGPDMSVGYLSRLVWALSRKYPGCAISTATGNHVIPTRVDYEKYISGEEDYFYRYPDSDN